MSYSQIHTQIYKKDKTMFNLKTNGKTRFLCILLCICIAVSLLSTVAFAANSTTFTDVSSTAWYYDGVNYVYSKGLMVGTNDNRFLPSKTTTRAMIVTILYSMEGKPMTTGEGYSDVSDSEYYVLPVKWANEHGIVAGYEDGTFRPSLDITRQQMISILYKYAAYKGFDTTTQDLVGYTDVSSISNYAVAPMGWAVKNGLISGVGDGLIGPQRSSTRAQVAVILQRFCENFGIDLATVNEVVSSGKDYYTITYYMNDSSTSNVVYQTQQVQANTSPSSITTPVRNGYTFIGWFHNKDLTDQFSYATKINSDVNLYAGWVTNSEMAQIRAQFIKDIAKYVQKYASSYGIKVHSPIIAQAILESGWGQSKLAREYYNYFGMKCGTKWTGKSVSLVTDEEFSAGTTTTIVDNFRAYNSMEEGVKGYFEFIQLDRYQNLKGITDPEKYLQTLKDDGYATSSTYVSNNMAVINSYNLTQYDP